MLFKQFAGVDAWPVCLATQDTDEIVRTVELHRPRLRRHQPRGHLRPALLRDRGPTARVARHPGVPRRPARHRHRGPRRPGERPAGGRQGLARVRRGDVGRRARPESPSSRCSRPRGSTQIVACDRAGVVHRAATAWTRASAGWPTTPTPTAQPARCATCWPVPTCSSGSAAPACSTRTTSPPWPPTRSCSPWPTPTPRSTRPGPADHAAVVATGRSDEPNQINNVLAFPGIFRGAAGRRGPRHHRGDEGRRGQGDRRPRCTTTSCAANYIVPSVFDRGVAPAVAEAVRHAAAAGSVGHGSGGSGGQRFRPPRWVGGDPGDRPGRGDGLVPGQRRRGAAAAGHPARSPGAVPTSPTGSTTRPGRAGCCAARPCTGCCPRPTTWAASTGSSPPWPAPRCRCRPPSASARTRPSPAPPST